MDATIEDTKDFDLDAGKIYCTKCSYYRNYNNNDDELGMVRNCKESK